MELTPSLSVAIDRLRVVAELPSERAIPVLTEMRRLFDDAARQEWERDRFQPQRAAG